MQRGNSKSNTQMLSNSLCYLPKSHVVKLVLDGDTMDILPVGANTPMGHGQIRKSVHRIGSYQRSYSPLPQQPVKIYTNVIEIKS